MEHVVSGLVAWLVRRVRLSRQVAVGLPRSHGLAARNPQAALATRRQHTAGPGAGARRYSLRIASSWRRATSALIG